MFPSSNAILSITSVLAIWLHAVCYKELSDKEFKIEKMELRKMIFEQKQPNYHLPKLKLSADRLILFSCLKLFV